MPRWVGQSHVWFNIRFGILGISTEFAECRMYHTLYNFFYLYPVPHALIHTHTHPFFAVIVHFFSCSSCIKTYVSFTCKFTQKKSFFHSVLRLRVSDNNYIGLFAAGAYVSYSFFKNFILKFGVNVLWLVSISVHGCSVPEHTNRTEQSVEVRYKRGSHCLSRNTKKARK